MENEIESTEGEERAARRSLEEKFFAARNMLPRMREEGRGEGGREGNEPEHVWDCTVARLVNLVTGCRSHGAARRRGG